MDNIVDRLFAIASRGYTPVGKPSAADVMLQAVAKIESDAKMIAALREALVCAAAMLEESGSGYISGSRSDTEWDKDRALVIETVKAALAAAVEQTVGK